MANPTKDLGPCAVIFNSIDLGATKGGVKFRYTEDTKPVVTDQTGSTEVDGIKVGASCEAEVPLTRTALAKLATVIGGASYSGNRLRVSVPVGISLYDNSQLLILKPIINNVTSADTATWLNIFKAYPKVDFDIVFDAENQRVYKTIFKGFPDASNNNKLWQMGA